ncbi:hypothetical protein A2303_05170 [Candidatus Falkowbacteria bacterium RIFOXYB2_FULL_47_14]|uniref:Uncharacterized protein n=1 Tax=Candidatus Falkowbacteria bacterium RIFOXYA2_FULL_47_19 TaxID=1797994 RepID=A0A1F5SJP0_9BACT|nr:MAG: hypothetical protein A2227_06550 [Candidatus Falkowbacteria bacterium RIFOXYA2_FULL_47_19]OGF35749.1 MAG: hypothetical protein A2468_05225 [Candidatus Falkowbacteria bacterium RIFOXYC2_FULL_46_15]OGF43307.1 MAG: hypothetical protein A2303_05170 [Candidatus Falkowbacteria bacterium RIFOXYB2_FULL_47_14]
MQKRYQRFVGDYIDVNLDFLISLAKRADKKDIPADIKEINSELLLAGSRGKSSAVNVKLGFPFPVAEARKKIIIKFNNQFDFFIKGERLRRLQRNFLREALSAGFGCRWRELGSKREFRKKFTEFSAGINGLTYVDPYGYIGDSFIGLIFPDSFGHALGVKKYRLFSGQHDHLLGQDARPFDIGGIIKDYRKTGFLLMPDLMDNHWDLTCRLILAAVRYDGVIAVPGRSFLLRIKDKSVVAYHLSGPDKFLHNQNIEDFLSDAIRVFVDDISLRRPKAVKNKSRRVYINPLASKSNRFMSVEFAIGLCRRLEGKYDLILIGGDAGNREHCRWIRNFKKNKTKDSRCSLKYYKNLKILGQEMTDNGCAAMVTVDTSIAHLANYLNIPNFTICPRDIMNNSSLRSMVGVAPLGFGRYYRNQLFALIDGYCNVSARQMDDIVAGIEYSAGSDPEKTPTPESEKLFLKIGPLKAPRDRNFIRQWGWTHRLFDIRYFLQNLGQDNPDYGRVLKTAVKLSNVYKIKQTILSRQKGGEDGLSG